MTLVGGLGTLAGPSVGALALISMEYFLVELGSWLTALQGLIFVVCVLTFRRGFVGEALAFLRNKSWCRSFLAKMLCDHWRKARAGC